MARKVYIYKGFERFWHWSQAALIIFLAFTGFEVHGSIELFGFEHAVQFHRIAAWLLMGLIAFAIFWHLTTGEWRQYIPTTNKLKEQVLYYSIGMFKGEQHPTHKSEVSKLNPLQRIVYLSFKLFLVPLTVITGIFYMFYKTFDANEMVVIQNIELGTLALWHTIGAWLLMIFLIVHVYMTTTGRTPVSNIQAMVTGYEELDEEENTVEEQERKSA